MRARAVDAAAADADDDAARGARARVRRASTRARARADDDARRDSRFASEDERRRAVERLAPPKRDGDRAKPRLRELGKKRAVGVSSDAAARGDAREAARRARLEKRDARATRESREIMTAMRARLDAWEGEIDGMMDFARRSVFEQAKTATEMFERLTDEGYGAVESAFAVMSWMDDAIEDAAARADEDAATSTSKGTGRGRVEVRIEGGEVENDGGRALRRAATMVRDRHHRVGGRSQVDRRRRERGIFSGFHSAPRRVGALWR